MSSINTNVSAMQALQSLNKTNEALETTQQRISTGFKVGDAKDNAAMWSVAQVMRSDVSGFNAISEQLSLGESTVAVARNASETVSELTEQIKERVVAAQGDNVDREKIQNDIDELVGQMESVVNAAQFNGTNLLKDEDGGTTFDVISSLDRDSDQNVTTSRINVDYADLTQREASGAVGGSVGAGTGTAALAAGDTHTIEVTSLDIGDTLTLEDTDSGETFSATMSQGDTIEDVLTRLGNSVTNGTGFESSAVTTGSPNTLDLTNASGGDVNINVTATGGAGAMRAVSEIDVTFAEGADDALSLMEGLTQTAIDAAANFGSAQMRIETQMDFVSKLSDSLEAGVGSLVDANMTEESAKLNALQVQQQLGTQALSIANQSPQALLSLFR